MGCCDSKEKKQDNFVRHDDHHQLVDTEMESMFVHKAQSPLQGSSHLKGHSTMNLKPIQEPPKLNSSSKFLSDKPLTVSTIKKGSGSGSLNSDLMTSMSSTSTLQSQKLRSSQIQNSVHSTVNDIKVSHYPFREINVSDNLFQEIQNELQLGIDLAVKSHKVMMMSLLEEHFFTEMEIVREHNYLLNLILQGFTSSLSSVQNSSDRGIESLLSDKLSELESLINAQLPFYIRKHEILMDNWSKKAKECTNAADCEYENFMEQKLSRNLNAVVNLNQIHQESSLLAMQEFDKLILEVGLKNSHLWEFELKAKIAERFSEYKNQYPDLTPNDEELSPDQGHDSALGQYEYFSEEEDSNGWESGDSVDSIGLEINKKEESFMGQGQGLNSDLLKNGFNGVRISVTPKLGSTHSILSDGSVDEAGQVKDTSQKIGRQRIIRRDNFKKIDPKTSKSSVDLAEGGANHKTEKSSVTIPNDRPEKGQKKGHHDNPGYSVVEKGPTRRKVKGPNILNPNDFFPAPRKSSGPLDKKVMKSNLIGPLTSSNVAERTGGISATFVISSNEPSHV